MAINNDPIAFMLFNEIASVDQTARAHLKAALPKGMQLSHFSVLNYLVRNNGEKSPAQLARIFQVTKAAMTNTITRLSAAGFVHVRPDWDDARKKLVSISPAGQAARDAAVTAIDPVFETVIDQLGPEKIKQILPILRELRAALQAD